MLDYIKKGCIPGGSKRNWNSYGHKIKMTDEAQINILCDPQTSGGLLVAVSPDCVGEYVELMKKHDMETFTLKPLGIMVERKEKFVEII